MQALHRTRCQRNKNKPTIFRSYTIYIGKDTKYMQKESCKVEDPGSKEEVQTTLNGKSEDVENNGS